MKKVVAVLLFVMIMCVSVMALGEEQALSQNVAAGDVITFGHYEQDNDLDNGPEAIEWIVLDVQDGKALLLSKYGLCGSFYDYSNQPEITWEKSTLRSWLNNKFLYEAFSSGEQSAILTTELDNSINQGYSEWNGPDENNTQDQIFLLSYAEAYKYLGVKDWKNDDGNNIQARVSPTAYAVAQEYRITVDDYYQTADGTASGGWWLRSPGNDLDSATIVHAAGSVSYDYLYFIYIVRPALWVDLSSGIF